MLVVLCCLFHRHLGRELGLPSALLEVLVEVDKVAAAAAAAGPGSPSEGNHAPNGHFCRAPSKHCCYSS